MFISSNLLYFCPKFASYCNKLSNAIFIKNERTGSPSSVSPFSLLSSLLHRNRSVSSALQRHTLTWSENL